MQYKCLTLSNNLFNHLILSISQNLDRFSLNRQFRFWRTLNSFSHIQTNFIDQYGSSIQSEIIVENLFALVKWAVLSWKIETVSSWFAFATELTERKIYSRYNSYARSLSLFIVNNNIIIVVVIAARRNRCCCCCRYSLVEYILSLLQS